MTSPLITPWAGSPFAGSPWQSAQGGAPAPSDPADGLTRIYTGNLTVGQDGTTYGLRTASPYGSVLPANISDLPDAGQYDESIAVLNVGDGVNLAVFEMAGAQAIFRDAGAGRGIYLTFPNASFQSILLPFNAGGGNYVLTGQADLYAYLQAENGNSVPFEVSFEPGALLEGWVEWVDDSGQYYGYGLGLGAFFPVAAFPGINMSRFDVDNFFNPNRLTVFLQAGNEFPGITPGADIDVYIENFGLVTCARSGSSYIANSVTGLASYVSGAGFLQKDRYSIFEAGLGP